MFALKGSMVYFTSNEGGSYATMFGPDNTQLKFRDDASRLQADHNSYIWAFEFFGQVNDGFHFVFATADRAIVGKMLGGTISVVDRVVEVVRDSEGQPLRLKADLPSLRKISPLSSQVKAVDIAHPKVSIITCSYNRPKMLLECIASVRAQTDGSWEHLIIDAGSTDPAVKDVLDRAAAFDPRVRVWRRSPNVNQPARYWNEMLDCARGDYICFLDDDNTKYPEFVAVLSAVLDASPDIDMVTCGWTMFTSADMFKDSGNDCHSNMSTDAEINQRNTIDTGAFLIRREAMERIGYFPHTIRTNEDWAIMRRAAACLKMEHLPDVLATYRCHHGQRAIYCESLGNAKDKVAIQSAVWGPVYGVRVFGPPFDLLTMSQRDVVEGAMAGVQAIPWVEDGSDLAVVFMPFRMEIGEAEMIASAHQAVVSVHSEDPFAVNANMTIVRAMAALCDTWVASNDTTCLEEYRSLVGERLIVCSSLSIDQRVLADVRPTERKYDVILVGYAYPGRVRFVEELIKYFDRKRLKIFGDGWREEGYDASPTASFRDTATLYSQARAVICLHRGQGACVDGPYEPKLVQRGYVEGMGGARVFLDTSRPDHAFCEGDVEWYDSAGDLAAKLTRFLALPDDKQTRFAVPLRERALRDFTYRTRMARIINAVRSPRFGAVIP